MPSPKSQLESLARSLGFGLFGVARAEPLDEDLGRLRAWLRRGDAAGMAYLARRPDDRADPRRALAGARSAVVVGMCYGQEPADPGVASGLAEGRVARFAQGRDYHLVLRPRLEQIAKRLEQDGERARAFVDTGPVLERALARRAGLGFIGKNTCLIHPRLGSWFVLGVVLTSVELPPDEPLTEEGCGSCRLCLDACPCGALAEPFRLDARRCLSYLTIETRDEIDDDTTARVGGRLFGCDACQEACPANSEAPACREPDLMAGNAGEGRLDGASASLESILCLSSNREFGRATDGSSLARARRSGLVRNAAIVAGNLGRRDLRERLEALAQDDGESAGVRRAAQWALAAIPDT